jgi:hypothetical protein
LGATFHVGRDDVFEIWLADATPETARAATEAMAMARYRLLMRMMRIPSFEASKLGTPISS